MMEPTVLTDLHQKTGSLRRSVVLAFCCYALSRISPFGEMRPFGLALFAVRFMTAGGMLLPALGVFLGSLGSRYELLSTGITLCVLFLCGIWGGERFRRVEVRIVCLSIATFLGGFVRFAMSGFMLYDLVLLLFSCMGTALCALAFSTIHSKGEQGFLSRLMTAVLLLLILSGFLGADFCGFLACLLALVFSIYTDAECAVLSGMVFGLCLGFLNGNPQVAISVLSLSALAASLLSGRGRLASALAFLLTVSAFGLLYLGSPFKTPGVFHALFAVAPVALIPKPLDLRLRLLFSEVAEGNTEKMHRFLNHRVVETGDAFLRLSEVYRRIVHAGLPKVEEGMLQRVYEGVCQNCTLNDVCWKRDVLRTQQQVCALLSKLDESGGVEKSDLTDRLRRRCPHTEEWIAALNHAYDLESQRYRNQRVNARTCMQVAGQFKTVSQILSDLSEELASEFVRYPSLEHQLYEQLSRKGRRILGITVVKNRYDRYEVMIRRVACNGQGDCAAVTRTASRLLGVSLQKDPSACADGECVLHLCEQERFAVVVGTAAAVKPGEDCCGDHHLVMPLRDGRFLLAISDGMGSGKEASEESGAVIELLGSFLSAGFEQNLAVKLINSALLLRGQDEMFATIDMAMIDLFAGTIDFLKIGSAESFFKSGDRLEMIASTSLPVGIVDVPDVEHTRRRICAGDFVVLASDGILDAFGGGEQFRERLLRLDTQKSPKRLARELLEEAKGKNPPHPDDMTLLLAQITA